MSEHSREEPKNCPNCGFTATRNYCAQCGQETHLHKETFFGLITHFIAHYFHYDSKFWQTLKTLWSKPGRLTIAYWEQKRMRYIPPISLYIFVSAVFFLSASYMLASDAKKVTQVTVESVDTLNKADTISTDIGLEMAKVIVALRDTVDTPQDIKERQLKVAQRKQQLGAAIPKMFFFMIPIMAFVLKLLFIRRKQMFYVNHAVFALHYHSFWFSLMFFAFLLRHFDWVTEVLVLATIVYFVIALRNAYKISWRRSVVYSFVIGAAYMISFVIVFVGALSWLAAH